MINRVNWKNLQAYLKYRQEVDQISAKSIRLEKAWLLHTLRWADEISFEKAPSIRPTFPEYIITARLDGSQEVFSQNYERHIIRSSHRFFHWLSKHRKGYSSITQVWLDTLRLPRLPEEEKEHEFVTIEEIRAIAQAPVITIRERRIRASAVFWFLSGIRIGAFVTLPIQAVDIENLTIHQWPKLGVKTKFRKHATTYLLDIPDLLEVVREWDNEIRQTLPSNSFWFAPVSPETGEFDLSVILVGENRGIRASKDLLSWLKKVDLPFHSPHKFRHGHAVYALKNAKDVPALKAVSQNLMHANLSVTDGVYGILSETDLKEQIKSIANGFPKNKHNEIELLIGLAKQILEKMDK